MGEAETDTRKASIFLQSMSEVRFYSPKGSTASSTKKIILAFGNKGDVNVALSCVSLLA